MDVYDVTGEDAAVDAKTKRSDVNKHFCMDNTANFDHFDDAN